MLGLHRNSHRDSRVGGDSQSSTQRVQKVHDRTQAQI
jgi:hypothetical protein